LRCHKRRQFVETIDGLQCVVCDLELDEIREHIEVAEQEKLREEFDTEYDAE